MNWRDLALVNLLNARRVPMAVQVVTVLVVASVAVATAGLIWRLSGLDDGRDRVALAPQQASASAATDITPILALAPFGGALAEVQGTAAGMILKAVFMAYPAEASSALIAVGDAPAMAVSPGQSLNGGAVVQSIGMDHVVLMVGGAAQRLEFPKPAGTAAAIPTTASAPSSSAPSASAAQTSAAGSAAATSGASSGVVPSVVEQYRQRLAGNPQAVASEMGITATAGGYRVGDNPAPELRAAGLQPGDVVEKVNNQAVSAANARTVLDQAIVSGGARVDVSRNGRRLTLSFPLR